MTKPASPYSIKSAKSTRGREGYGYNATLCKDGKPIALVIDHADGGPSYFEWKDRSSAAADAKALSDYAKSLPPATCPWDDPATGKPAILPMTYELYIEELVNEFMAIKKLTSEMKRKILIVKGGKLLAVKAAPTPENIAQVAKHEVVVNTMSQEAQLAMFRECNAI